MSFLQPSFLWALPIALLPVLIHLIHLQRRRTVAWAATRFLLAARKLNRGYSRLRRLLILCLRVLAVAALIGVISRPLAGGLLGLTGGTPDTVMILLDRSASMQQQDLATGISKREAGLAKLSRALREAYRGRSRLILIDSATNTPQEFDSESGLNELPASWATDTSADLPAMLEAALDYLTVNKPGRTDIWILSDLQAGNWDASNGRWEALQAGFTAARGVRFHLLTYPEPAADNLSLSVEDLQLRSSDGQAQLVLDIEVSRHSPGPASAATTSQELPIRFLVNGNPSMHLARLGENGRLSLRGHTIALAPGITRGWGRVELPTDSHPADNVWHFVFDRPPLMRSAVIAEDPAAVAAVTAALEAPADPSRDYRVDALAPRQVAEVDWNHTALIVWQAGLPAAQSLNHQLLVAHLKAGRSVLFLPPARPGPEAFLGVSWGALESVPDRVSWWRSDSGLLADTRSGSPLPVGELEITRRRAMMAQTESNILPLARLESDNTPLLLSAFAPGHSPDRGVATFLATSIDFESSTLANDGVVLYALLHRALEAGAASLGTVRQRTADRASLGSSPDLWAPLPDSLAEGSPLLPPTQRSLVAGVLSSAISDTPPSSGAATLLTALNRPPAEDDPSHLDDTMLAELFRGLDYRITTDSLDDDSPLASEIWKTFLLLMAAALLIETLVSLPQPRPVRAPAGDDTTTIF